MAEVYVTLSEAAELEGVQYQTMARRTQRNKKNFVTKTEKSETGGRDVVLVAVSSLSKQARNAWKEREKLKSFTEEFPDKKEDEQKPEVPWYVNTDVDWYIENYKERYYKAVELGNVVRKFLQYDEGDRTKYAEEFAQKYLGKGQRTLYRYTKAYLEASAWADKLEKEDGAGREFFKVLCLCRKPKETGCFPSIKPEVKQVIKNIWFNEDFARNQGTREMLYEKLTAIANINKWEKIPSYQTVTRYISYLMEDEGMRNAWFLASRGTREYKNKVMVKGSRDTKGLQVMQIVMGDEHTFDCWVSYKQPNGKVIAIKPHLAAWVDMRSRVIMGDVMCKDAKRMLERGELLTLEEFYEKWHEWLTTVYMHTEHSGLKKMGETYKKPYDCFMNEDRYFKAAPPKSYATMLMMKSENVLVRNIGITKWGYEYRSDELCDYIGRKVDIKYDPDDMAVLYVFDQKGKRICEAYCQELLQIAPKVTQKALEEHLKMQKRQQKRDRERLEEARRPFEELNEQYVGFNETTISNKIQAAKDTVSSVLDSIKSAFSSKLEAARSVVSSTIEKIKGVFNFSWKLPDLKLPHISVNGGQAPYGIGGKGSLPSFSIQWYKEGGILNGATIFGAMGGNLLGGGEAGAEAVLPLSELWKQMTEIVKGVVKGENEESGDTVQQTGANITSALTSKAASVRKEKESKTTTTKETYTSERWGKEGGTTIHQISFTVDISKIKDLPLLYKLIDELKDAQNRTDSPTPATT